MGYELQLTKYPIARLIYLIENGELDGALSFGKNAEREKIFVYPESAFMQMKPAILTLKVNRIEIKAISDLEKLTGIGIYNKGYLSPMMRGDKIKKSRIAQEDVTKTGIEMVLAGRLHAFYSPDSEELKWSILNLKNKLKTSDLDLIYLPENPLPLYTVFAKHNKHLAQQYDKILKSRASAKEYSSYLGGN